MSERDPFVIADDLGDGLGERVALPESWTPLDPCPRTGRKCSDGGQRCWQDGFCILRTTTTSDLAAEAGAILARWAEEAGAEGMCGGCAFRRGTRANRTDDTIYQILTTCIPKSERFYCHEGIEYGEAPRKVCRGWAALHAQNARKVEL